MIMFLIFSLVKEIYNLPTIYFLVIFNQEVLLRSTSWLNISNSTSTLNSSYVDTADILLGRFKSNLDSKVDSTTKNWFSENLARVNISITHALIFHLPIASTHLRLLQCRTLRPSPSCDVQHRHPRKRDIHVGRPLARDLHKRTKTRSQAFTQRALPLTNHTRAFVVAFTIVLNHLLLH